METSEHPRAQRTRTHGASLSRREPTSPKRPRTPDNFSPRSDDEAYSPPADRDHQRFVLTDPIAFRYLEQDPSTTVLARREELKGYECYIVEQWTTSRAHPTFAITTYTGDPSHVVVVGVLSVPTDESTWSPPLRIYFKALNQYHARRRDTPLGVIMVTNLASFPSSLTVIPVPDGDLRKHRSDYFINENLKRLGCSGRSGLALVQPAPATVAKYLQLYKTSDKVDISFSVIELVKLCQSALTLFAKLEVDYADGLLCDVTERAIGDWWVDIGIAHYGVEPHDGVLGPTTVAALLGLLMGARNRLHAIGAPVPKDPFDVEAMKRGIGGFQKQQRMSRTRRLDRSTLERLHKLTQKAAEKDRWAVPRAVKSTVAELSGKGGEMVMDAVSRRDRAGIAEIETVDMDRFAQLVFGDRARWLWQGKASRKPRHEHHLQASPDQVQENSVANRHLVFKDDDHGGFAWASGRKSTIDNLHETKTESERRSFDGFGGPLPVDGADDGGDDGIRASVIKRASALRHEAKSGLGKVKGAVSLRGHRARASLEAPVPPNHDGTPDDRGIYSSKENVRSPKSVLDSPEMSGQEHNLSTSLQEASIGEAASERTRPQDDERLLHNDPESAKQPSEPLHTSSPHHREVGVAGNGFQLPSFQSYPRSNLASDDGSTAPTADGVDNVDTNDDLATDVEETPADILLRRSVSYSQYVDTQRSRASGDNHPRHLSFSMAEEALLSWQSLGESSSDYDDYDDLPARYTRQETLGQYLRQLRASISVMEQTTVNWTQEQLKSLGACPTNADDTYETLANLHRPLESATQELTLRSERDLAEVKDHLSGVCKEIETLSAKLEYELHDLRSKIEDVDAGVLDFEKGVTRAEDRVAELEALGDTDTSWKCVMC